MRITDLLKSESIMLGAQPKDKRDAIAILTGLMEKGGIYRQMYRLQRESEQWSA